MGIKWSSSTDAAETTTDVPSNGPSNGQLQVYIVEGAGMVDEDTHKPFNAFIKWYIHRLVRGEGGGREGGMDGWTDEQKERGKLFKDFNPPLEHLGITWCPGFSIVHTYINLWKMMM